jgi:hypothetical protein
VSDRQRRFHDRERTAQQGFGFVDLAGCRKQVGQICEVVADIGMVRTECGFFNPQRPPERRFGFCNPTDRPQMKAEINESVGDVGMVGTAGGFGRGEALPIEVLGFLVAALHGKYVGSLKSIRLGNYLIIPHDTNSSFRGIDLHDILERKCGSLNP